MTGPPNRSFIFSAMLALIALNNFGINLDSALGLGRRPDPGIMLQIDDGGVLLIDGKPKGRLWDGNVLHHVPN